MSQQGLVAVPGCWEPVCFKVDPPTGNSGKIVAVYELLFSGDGSYSFINRGVADSYLGRDQKRTWTRVVVWRGRRKG